MTYVDLTHDEVLTCYSIGALRDIQSRARGAGDTYGSELMSLALRLENNVRGAMGEGGLAKHIDAWDEWVAGAVGDPSALDVPPWEVRTTSPGLSLIAHEKERHEDAPFMLAYVAGMWPTLNPRVHLKGWAFLKDIRKQEHWKSHVRTPAFFVPPHALDKSDNIRETTIALRAGALA